ncbi:hypothetical protein CWO92_01530 [Heyndrickxia camelliae]|uniref:Uncharacterized protein n=1 Tax=Heyndrickxia camelliae TaxID=1707093 RepID=A0A2N3LQD2_9BACI|nr:hypothetical protein CWO92_01530 [Heyndrickxia camelliae]
MFYILQKYFLMKGETAVRKYTLFLLILFIFFSFWINILGLMKLIPILITSPILFLSLFLLLVYLNGRNTFRGFH